MPSLIPGYDYDIFVSYRKKDNKYDGWVTEFVDNLRRELEATFKEQVTVYFDENAFDGIQETHHVDLSLGQKLRSLVFIPIVSQTYCDPQSYAWKNELLVFRRMAAEDRFGLQITLPNGNVASRIVPVRIHELDESDRLMLEQELGSPLRSVDFIYRSPGVNRPLRASEENLEENERKTSYRNQINKTANLLKDLVLSMRTPQRRTNISVRQIIPVESRTPAKRNKLLVAAAIAVIVVIGLLFMGQIRKVFTPNVQKAATLAVLPFKVIGNEEEGQYLADGVMDVLLSNLRLFPGIKVKPRTSVERYRETQMSVGEIGRELDVLYILEGSTQKVGENIRIVVQLIDATTEEGIWSQKFDLKFENVFQVQNQISEVIARSLKAKLTPDISEKLSKMPTDNFEAYDLFLRSRQAARRYEATGDVTHLEMAKSLLKQSLRRDPGFAKGYAWLAAVQALSMDESNHETLRDSVYLLAHHAIQLDSSVVEANIVLSEMYDTENDAGNALRFTYKALGDKSLDSASSVRLVIRLAEIYSRLGFGSRALRLYDMLLMTAPDNLEVLHLKFYPLASGGQPGELSSLGAAIKLLAPHDELAGLVDLHLLIQGKDYDAVVDLYDKVNAYDTNQWRSYAQHVIAFVSILKAQGKTQEAEALMRKVTGLFSGDDFVLAQISLFLGHDERGLKMLSNEEVGWFNLRFCEINPVFDHVRTDERFQDFLDRNKSRIENERDRIIEFEGRGYLPMPEDFFAPSGSDLGSS